LKALIFLLLIGYTASGQVKDIFEYGSMVNDYIANNLVKSQEKEINISQIDSIFGYALSISDSNVADALLFCSVGVMTYSVFNVRLPYLNFRIPVPVFTYLDKNKFQRKVENLPSKLFDDSPESEFGDKDKVVHFFSTAYLSYIFGDNFSNHIGSFVEIFEEDFKVDGKIDERDLRIDELGAEFGKELRCKIIFPSFILAKEKSLTYGKNTNN